MSTDQESKVEPNESASRERMWADLAGYYDEMYAWKDYADEPQRIEGLIICHGDFLNANHTYVPTPFALTTGTTGQRTLIVPEDIPVDDRLVPVGHLERIETEEMVVGYTFDFTTNQLTPNTAPTPPRPKEARWPVT